MQINNINKFQGLLITHTVPLLCAIEEREFQLVAQGKRNNTTKQQNYNEVQVITYNNIFCEASRS